MQRYKSMKNFLPKLKIIINMLSSVKKIELHIVFRKLLRHFKKEGKKRQEIIYVDGVEINFRLIQVGIYLGDSQENHFVVDIKVCFMHGNLKLKPAMLQLTTPSRDRLRKEKNKLKDWRLSFNS